MLSFTRFIQKQLDNQGVLPQKWSFPGSSWDSQQSSEPEVPEVEPIDSDWAYEYEATLKSDSSKKALVIIPANSTSDLGWNSGKQSLVGSYPEESGSDFGPHYNCMLDAFTEGHLLYGYDNSNYLEVASVDENGYVTSLKKQNQSEAIADCVLKGKVCPSRYVGIVC